MQDTQGLSSKKCNCKQSQCIKLYCECYAAGVYCSGCHCFNCKNNDQSQSLRNQAISNMLQKNPTAFLPKISQKAELALKVVDPLNLGKHNKGCACKKSGCMKKYCECYQAGILCSENCKCTDCYNTGFFSHGNLLRQFREDETYNYQNQILHKFLLAHNEEHLNSILSDQNGGNDLGFYKRGIPIKTEFIKESCMKLLQILHSPDDDIYKKRDFLLMEKYQNSSNIALKLHEITQQEKTKNTPKKSEEIIAETSKNSENYNKDTSYDIDLVCQDENMDDEEDQQVNHQPQCFEEVSQLNKEVKGAGEHLNRDSEISPKRKDINESNLTEQTAAAESINMLKTFQQITNKKQDNFGKNQKEGDKIICEEDGDQIKQEEEEKNESSENKDNNKSFGERKGDCNEKQEFQSQSSNQKNGAGNQEGIEMDIECHSSNLKRKQELYEIRRSFILDTFIELLRNVEETI